MIKILALAGSTRSESFNKKILKVAVFGAREAGAEVTIVDLQDYRMPLYDGDFEQKEGLPSNVLKIKELFSQNHGFLFALPEYNGSLSGVFKNTIDWVSRSDKGEAPLHCFNGKVAGLISASPGNFGGMRGLVHARSLLEIINVVVMPEQVCVPRAHEVIDEYGNIRPEITMKSLEKLGANLVDLTLRVRGFQGGGL